MSASIDVSGYNQYDVVDGNWTKLNLQYINYETEDAWDYTDHNLILQRQSLTRMFCSARVDFHTVGVSVNTTYVKFSQGREGTPYVFYNDMSQQRKAVLCSSIVEVWPLEPLALYAKLDQSIPTNIITEIHMYLEEVT